MNIFSAKQAREPSRLRDLISWRPISPATLPAEGLNPLGRPNERPGPALFTRFNNLSIEPRNERQARTLSIATNRGSVALSKAPLFLRATLVILTLATTLLVSAAPAGAAALYKYDPVQTAALGSFSKPGTLTFDSAGNLYVADPGNPSGGVIDKFDSENAFVAQLGPGVLSGNNTRGVAVNDETGHVYVADTEHDEVFALGGAGEELSRWTGASTPTKTFGQEPSGEGCCFIYDAVDNSNSPSKGLLYVLSEHEGGEVVALEPQSEDKEEGKYVRSLELPPKGFSFLGFGNEGLAVNDSTGPEAGEVYVVDPGHKVIDRFSAEGTFEASHQLTGPSPSQPFQEPAAVAVDDETGDVWVVDHAARAVYEFSPSGALLAQITEAGGEALGSPLGIAVQRSGPHKGDVFVADAAKHRIDVFAVEQPGPPLVTEAGATELTGDSVTLTAHLKPEGDLSKYQFEYGACITPETCPESPYAPVGEEGSLGSGEDFSTHRIAASVQGLTPSTTYHFRVRAQNSHGPAPGEEVIFTTQGQGGELVLPDSRGWELVSPPDKHGGTIGGIPEVGVIEAAANGDAISYLANAPLEAGAQGSAGKGIQELSQRETSGWSTRAIAPPHQRATGAGAGTAPEYRFFAEDLSAAIVQPYGLFNPALSTEASEQTPFLRTLGGCTSDCYAPLVSAANVPAGTHFGEERLCEEENGIGPKALTVCGPLFLDATKDLSHAVLVSAAPLTQGAPTGKVTSAGSITGSLYEWSAGQLQLVSVLPASEAGEELPAAPGATLGAGFGKPEGSARQAISDDGRRIFWNTGGASPTALYMRDTALGKSIELDNAETACVEEGECESGGGRFQIASADGSRVFFSDTHRLTKDSGAAFEKSDLYECRIGESAGKPTCALTDLTPGTGGERAEVQGSVLGDGESGEGLYFVAKGTLGTAPNARGEAAVAGQANLYVRRGGQTSLVARLSGGDSTDWSLPPGQPTRVSPNGQFLAFMSERPLSGYDNHDAASGELDAEVFLYDADAGSVACASCDPTGARPTGIEYGKLEGGNQALATVREQWPSASWVAALVPDGSQPLGVGLGSGYQSRYLSNSGRLFFNALGGLVPQDVNGIGDVYEHEPLGIKGPENEEDCTTSMSTFSERDGGCLSLISSGASSRQSQFLDASENGDDVFFLTNAKLSPQDLDSNEDIYDAHVCSGESPCISQPASPPVCSTEASCKAAPTPPPGIFGAPPSATFNGLGNPTAPAAAVVKPKAKPLTRAQKLAAALKACKKKTNKAKRSGCEKQARSKYGPLKKTKKRKG
jgi:DNA-binding beta-propeller fold protein YncE